MIRVTRPPEGKHFAVHLPNLLREMVESNPGGSALVIPVRCVQILLEAVAKRAIALDDPELNALMLDLALYEVDPSARHRLTKEQRSRCLT